jgi:hypothetical protein
MTGPGEARGSGITLARDICWRAVWIPAFAGMTVGGGGNGWRRGGGGAGRMRPWLTI